MRQRDPITGGEKDVKLARYDLLPDSVTTLLTAGFSDLWASLDVFWNHGGGRPELVRVGLILAFALGPGWPTRLAEVFGWGAGKYAPRNWERGYPWSWAYAALRRHIAAWLAGEPDDPESGLPHLAHALWHVVVLMHFLGRYREGDDRPQPNLTTAPS
ncbi:MAG: DUF5664 domain-containing protein [Armatimonadota bacterium]|nr:DUF5664 domain-containing protein [Armatimonadota bacterium]MDR7559483.1 DUF5664 domain-containing protein [Armatimonadota bacterium]